MLLAAQASERSMGLCPRQGLFICRCAPSGRRVIFATQAYDQEPGAVLNMQASVSFAARAAYSSARAASPKAEEREAIASSSRYIKQLR